ncbi:vesicular glutamate transporter 2.2-like isoform X2 [Planococcus citri]|uniref:vesicular glutamate transporter 2.2-like isoform X2 n=1 Tax=Planococcus citri TaxID=170843 RepID=UPI0031F8C8D8
MYRDTTSQITDDNPSFWLSKRLLVATVLFISFVNFQLLRNNINITIVEMISNKTIGTVNNTDIVKPPDFDWDSSTTGLITSILAYGGLFSIFADLAINRIGGSVTCAWSMLLAGVLTMLHPAILNLHFYLFLACRFFTGIFEMLFYVGTSDIFSRWFPMKEMSALISFSFNGTNIGLAAVYPFCAYLAHKWGWQMVFYVTGFMGVIFAILSLVLVKNQPSDDKWISKKELAYILEETNHTTKMNVSHPYWKILTSVPVWALCCTVFVYMWVTSVISACLPLFIRDLTHKETDEIGYISSIPNIVYIFLFPIDGAIMDYWKNNSGITVTRMHKIIISIAFLFASVMFVTVAVAFTSSLIASMSIFVLIQVPMSFVPIILQVLVVNLSADHSAVVGGLLSFFFSLSAIACQTMTGFMIPEHSLQEWNNCFYLAAAISAFGAVIFMLFGSSELQPWALTSPSKKERHLSETD